MADHQATWVRLREVARLRLPDDDMAAELAVRELFDAEEAAVYAADLDAQAEEQGVLDTARATTCLRGELQEELRAEALAPAAIRRSTCTWTPTTSPTSSSPPTRRPQSPLPSRRC
jgi:hypothetical protein